MTLFEDSGFDLRSIEDGPIRQLEWLTGTNFIIAITNTLVSNEISIVADNERTIPVQ